MPSRSGASARQGPPDVSAESKHILHDHRFRAYWLSRIASQTAQAALLYGLLILIVDRSERSIYASIFVLCSIAPAMLFGLIGGWVADRLPQRTMLVALNLARAAVVALLLRTGADLPTVFVVTFGIWTIHQFYAPGESAALARVVGEDRIPEGTAMSNLALTIAQVAGMVILAPLLLKLPDERFLFAVSIAGYTVAAMLASRIGRLHEREPRARRRMPLDLRHGWRVATSDCLACGAFINATLISIGMSALVVIVPYYLENVLDTDAGNTVFVFAPAVLGLLVGLKTAPAVGRRFGHGRLASIGLIGFSIVTAGFGLIDEAVIALRETHLPVGVLENQLGISARTAATMLISIPAGYFSATTDVAAKSLLLEFAPVDSRGQLFATQSVVANAGALIPALLAGIAVDQIGVRPVAIVVALLLLLGAGMGHAYSLRVAARPLRPTAEASVNT